MSVKTQAKVQKNKKKASKNEREKKKKMDGADMSRSKGKRGFVKVKRKEERDSKIN